jgi:hypothetical protein
MLRMLIIMLALTACIPVAPVMPVAIPTPTPERPNGQPAIDSALAFLQAQYNPTYQLLQESPDIGKHRYYITNDNMLAAHVFALYGIEKPMDLRGKLGNDFIEIAFGFNLSWPPYHHADVVIEQHGEDQVLYESHDGPGYFSDWSGFSNLACMAVVNEFNAGNLETARSLYQYQLNKFDGKGWPDLAYQRRDGVYETLGLAWCLYGGALLNQPSMEVMAMLLAQQASNGGFHTHYRAETNQLADPNIETTSMAILALRTVQQGPPTQLGLP